MNLAHITIEDVEKAKKKPIPEEKPVEKPKYKVVKIFEAETAESEDAE